MADALIAGRYRCLHGLGSGGMADVFEAVDERRGERVALKLLRADTPGGVVDQLHQQLFEREFHVLSQLHHPRVVSVFDYGIAEAGPFYTMELLQGNDLSHVAPLPWRSACAVLRDVCSVLSLLHSRRLVYRDLSPRNVFCSSAGVGKLIDFGALVSVGDTDDVVGTPPFAAPECVHRQLLDGRADLYGVGVTLHFALTGQLLFPAHKFEDLPLLWRLSRRPAPAHLESFPRDLQALISDLVQLDASLRPATAGEVIDRLEAIAELDRIDPPAVKREYLATPELVERDAQLEQARQQLREVSAGRGSSLLVTGAAGTGRSRFLDACILQSKLLGLNTLVVRAGDGQMAPYDGVRALALQLMEVDPARCLAAAGEHGAALGHAVPVLLGTSGVELARFDDPRTLRPALQAALRAWFEAVTAERPLLIAIDDFDRLDEPSAAFVALLAADAPAQRRAVFASAGSSSDVPLMPMLVLRRMASSLTLPHLSEQATRALLASLFGETPKLPLLAGRVHQAAGGNPRDVLQLTRNLVDGRIIHWEAGGWALPSALHADALPASATDAMRLRVQSLGERGLELARLLATSQLPALSLDDFSALCQQGTGEVIAGLGQLVAAELLRTDARGYRFSHPAWREILTESVDPEARRQMHRRLARLLAETGRDRLREIQHLLWSGQDDTALERLVVFCVESQLETKDSPVRFLDFIERLPRDWYVLFDWGIEQLRERGGSPAAICALRGRMAAILPTTTPHLGARHVSELLRQLASDAGLDDYAGLETATHEGSRLQAALLQAQRRFDAAPEHERVSPPALAIRQLAEIMIPAAAIAGTTYDYELWREGPCLDPLLPLSPALRVVALTWQGLGEHMSGRLESALASYSRAVALLGQPDQAGLSASHAKYGRLGLTWGLGMLHATLGLPACLAHAEVLKQDPWYRVSGILVEMLHAYWQGDPARGDAEKERWMLCLVESNAGRWFEGGHLVAELTAHATAGDLDRLRAVVPDISKRAALCPGWRPVYQYALGEYHRLRGDLSEALAAHTRARTARPACEHRIWAQAASAELEVLIALDRQEDAIRAGVSYLEAAVRAGLLRHAQQIRIPLARAHAQAGQLGRACELIEEVLSALEATGATGLILASAHEARAQIALCAGELELARRALRECCVHFRAEANALGRRRCERLERVIAAHALAQVQEREDPRRALARVQVALEAQDTAPARARALLQLLVDETGARGGMLRLSGGATAEAMDLGLGAQRRQLEELLDGIVSLTCAEQRDSATVTVTGSDPPPVPMDRYRTLVLQHGAVGERIVSGAALLVVGRDEPFVEPEALLSAISQVLSDTAAARVATQELSAPIPPSGPHLGRTPGGDTG